MPDTGYWILGAGYWMLDAGTLIIDYWIIGLLIIGRMEVFFDTGYWMLDTSTW